MDEDLLQETRGFGVRPDHPYLAAGVQGPEPTDPEEPETDESGGIIRRGIAFGGQLFRSTIKGAALAGDEILELTGENIGAPILKHSGAYKLFGDDEEDADWLDWYESRAESHRAIYDGERSEGLWGAYEGLVQFGTGFVVGGVALKAGAAATGLTGVATGSGLARAALRFTRATAQGAIADFSVFDSEEERLSDMVAGTALENPVSRYLESDVDDTEIEARMKNVLEGAFLGGAVDGVLGSLKLLRAVRAHRAGRITAEEASEIVEESLRGARDAADEVAHAGVEDGSLRPLYSTRPDNEVGDWVMEVVEGSEGRLPEGAPPVQRFESAQEAHRAAASFNLVDEVLREAPAPVDGRIQLTDAQRLQFDAVRARIQSGVDPKDAEALLEGIDFNFGRVTSDEQSLALINSLSEVLKEPFDAMRVARGGGRTFADIAAAAEDMIPGMSGADMVSSLQRLEGAVADAPERILAGRIVLHGQARRLAKLADAVDLDPQNTMVVKAMADEMDNLANLGVTLAGTQSSFARTVASMGIDVDAASLKKLREGADQAAAQAENVDLKPGDRRRRPFLRSFRNNNLSAEEIASIARSLKMADGDPYSVLRVMRLTGQATAEAGQAAAGARQAGLVDKLLNYRVSMMLYGPKTHATNFLSSAANAVLLPSETFIQGVYAGDKVIRRQALDELASPMADNFHVIRTAMHAARESFNRNSSILDPRFTKNELGEQVALENDIPTTFFGRFVAAPNRLLMASDEFIKRTSYLSHVRGQSLRRIRELAEQNGRDFTPDEIRAIVSKDMERAVDGDIANGGGQALWVNSLQRAREATFTQPLYKGSIGGSVQQFVNSNPYTRFFMPFVRTPMNLLTAAIQRSPLTLLSKETRALLTSGDPADKALVAARMTTGTLALSGAAMLHQSGLLTGGGPTNPRLRSQMLNAGWQPYSFRVGDKWVSYRRMEPMATIMGVTADMMDMVGEAGPEQAESMHSALLAAFFASASSKTFLTGMVDFMDLVASGSPPKVEGVIGGSLNTLVPAFLRQGNPDPIWREANGYMETVARSIPGWSMTLEPRRNLLGEAVVRPGRQAFSDDTNQTGFGYLNDAFNPMTVVDASDIDDIQMELAGLGRSLSMPRDKRGQIELRDRETWLNSDPERRGQSPYDRWMELVAEPERGTPLREDLAELIRSDRWQNSSPGTEMYPGGDRWTMAQRRIRTAHDRAWRMMLREYPELRQALQTQDLQERAASRGIELLNQ